MSSQIKMILILYISTCIAERDFSSLRSFEDAVNILTEVCSLPYQCGGAIDYSKPLCCGICMCAENCLETASCCLDMYDNFTHLTHVEQNKRSSCLPAQYLPYKDTKFSTDFTYVFVTTCDRENVNENDRYLCETPVSELDDLEAIVPVTEPVTGRLYKNRYCAYCNHVHRSDQLIDWKLWINSNQHMTFPRSNLLEEMRKTRGNILFDLPTGFIDELDYECSINLQYTIGTCNQTGLWEEYNALIQEACESPYIDSFNNTYKNFFCFLCNEKTPVTDKDVLCSDASPPNQPGFSAVYDLKAIVYGPDTDRLVCSDKQFADEEMRVCRDIFCFDYHYMYYGKCETSQITSFSPTCVSAFMKLTPQQLDSRSKLKLSDKKVITREIHFKIFSETAQNIKLFFKTNDEGYNEYIVVYIEIVFETVKSIDLFLEDVVRLTESDMSFGTDLNYSAEMALYQLIISDQTAKLLVPNTIENSFDELLEYFTPAEENLCLDKEKIPLSKLFNCPYIKLSFGEIPMTIELDFLLIFDKFVDHKIIRKLSRWEYERQEETVKICFKEYIIIKNAIARSRADTSSPSVPLTLSVSITWPVFAIIFLPMR